MYSPALIVLVLVAISFVNTQLTCFDCDPAKGCSTINEDTPKLMCENSTDNSKMYTDLKKRIQELEFEEHLLQIRSITSRDYQCYTLVAQGSNKTESGVFRGCLAITDGFTACDFIQDEIENIKCTSCDTNNCNNEDENVDNSNSNITIQKDGYSEGNTFYPKFILIILLFLINMH